MPNAFIQTKVPCTDHEGDRFMMKTRGAMADMLIQMEPENCVPHVSMEKGQKVLHAHVRKAICGMLQSALLFYKKLRKDLEKNGFEVNPCDPCVANEMINGKQMTVSWHVDDLKASHADGKALEDFAKWINDKHGEHDKRTPELELDEHGQVAKPAPYDPPGKPCPYKFLASLAGKRKR